MNGDTRILKLIEKIDAGRISGTEVARQLDQIEQAYGSSYVIYSLSDRTDPVYYEKLLSDARLGIYSRQSLIRMAEIRYAGNGVENKRLAFIIGGVALVAIVIVIIAIVTGGKS